MLSLTPLILHLTPAPQGFNHPWFRKVDGAADFAQMRVDALPKPAAWVMRAGDKSSHAGERAENLTISFDVVIAIENRRSHAPGESDEILLAYRVAVKNLLLGWELEPDVRPIKYDGGKMMEFSEGDMFWQERYTLEALITNYLPDPAPFESLTRQGTNL